MSFWRASSAALVWRALLCSLCMLTVACNANLGPTSLENPNSFDLSAKKPGLLKSRPKTTAPSSDGRGNYQLFPGQQQEMSDAALEAPPGVTERDGKFTVNVDRAEINEVSKLILGETLGLSYVVDPRVQGTITLSSSRPLASSELLDAFESALRLNGAALIQSDNGIAKVVALQEVLDGEMGSADMNGAASSGYGVSAIPLRYISPANMIELMDSFIARGGTVRASNIGNLILVRGTAAERRQLVNVVMSFDVDWMKNQTASIAILANSTPAEIVTKLEAVFAQDTSTSGNNALKVIPLERLNGVIIVSNSQQKVRRALAWVGRLDKRSTTDVNYYVYAVQNGTAENLAKILISTFVDKSDAGGLSSEVAPDQPTVQLSTDQSQSGDQTDQSQQDNADQNQGAQAGKSDRQGQEPTLPSENGGGAKDQQQQSSALASGMRITPNPSNNTIVIRATEKQYQRILATLRQIDSPAVQILINTTIAEVTLNNNLRYGVQAYFRDKGDNGVGGGFFGGDSLQIAPSFPGFNFFFGKVNSPKLMLDALSAVTNVKVISSPSVMVVENEIATIKVGDQVPIQTQSQNATGTNNQIISSFEYRDTGVILKVKPRVNNSGLVTMEVAQELSSVAKSPGTTKAEKENPTFSQRTVSSKVSVYSAQTVVLGGLISGQENRQRDSVPGINKIPVLGDIIGTTDNSSKRNELIVFITPQVVEDAEDAARVSEELRAKMKGFGLN